MGKFMESGFGGGLIGGVLNAVSGIGQGLIQRKTDEMNVQRQKEANKELSEYQYGKDLQMWERQNEYNNPSSQMERLKQAGLNPNMAYGSGSVAGNTGSQLPKYNAISQKTDISPVADLPSMISMYQDMNLKQAQINNVNAQSDINRQEARFRGGILHNRQSVLASNADLRKMERDWSYSDPREMTSNQRGFTALDYNLEQKKERIRQTGVSIESMRKNMGLLNEKIAYQQKVNELYQTALYGRLGIAGFNAISKLLPTNLVKTGLKGISGKFGKSTKPTWKQDQDWGRMKNLPY